MKALFKGIMFILPALLVLFVLEHGVLSQEEEESSTAIEFVGAAKCKMCHNKPARGLCPHQRTGGGAVRHHDQGRRLQHPACV